MKKSWQVREAEKLIDMGALRAHPHAKKGGEAWVQAQKKRMIKGFVDASVAITLAYAGHKLPSDPAQAAADRRRYARLGAQRTREQI